MLHFSYMNIHVAAKNSCADSRVNGKMCSLVLSRTYVAYELMNRTPRTQSILAMGFAAQGTGSSCAACITKFELLASAQAGVATAK